jgi:hypothetical protein
MRNFIILLLFAQSVFAQTELKPFSELSGTQDYFYQSYKTDYGFIYGVPIPAYDANYRYRLYKLNEDGKMMDSLYIGNDSIRYTGYLHRQNNKNYFIAAEYKMNLIGNLTNFFANVHRVLFEIDDNMKISSFNRYEKLPFGFSKSIYRFTLGIGSFHAESAHVQKDTLQLVQYFLAMDSLGTTIATQNTHFEQLGLGANKSYKNTKLLATQGVYSSFITDDYFYIFGELNFKYFPPNQPYNAGLMGRFDKTGKLLQTADIDSDGSGAMGDGVVGVHHNNKIYCAYSKITGVNNEVVRLASFDRKDMNFKLEKRTRVKTYDMIPRGSNPFAFADNGDIYFLTQKSDTVGISKHSKDLDFIWEKKYKLPQHTPISIKMTKDGGILLECTEAFTIDKRRVKLYKLNADGNIISTTNLGNITSSKNLFYPNPFQSQLTLHEAIEGASEVQLYDMSGRVVGIFPIHNTTIEINEQLPKGAYIAQLKDVKGSILGMQTIIKQ